MVVSYELEPGTGATRVCKAGLNETQLQAVRDGLMVTPKGPDFLTGQTAQPFPVYLETKGYVYVPPHAPGSNCGMSSDPPAPHQPGNWACSITLRPYQEPVVARVLDALHSRRGCLLSLQCGQGKTICAVYTMCQLRVPTLVIVHKSFLMDQFRAALEAYVPAARIGVIQGPVCDWQGKDVVLGMLQTLCGDALQVNSDMRKYFGLVVVDECHHIAARVFSRAMLRFPTHYTLGLSATPERKDGLGRVVAWFVGNDTVTSDAVTATAVRPSVCVQAYQHPSACTCGKYGREIARTIGGKRRVVVTSMVTDLVRCPCRTRHVAEVVAQCLKDEPSRNVLVVSERRDHLQAIALELDSMLLGQAAKVGTYVGGIKPAERERVATECNVILGSYAMTREGLDIAKLDTLIMASPTNDVVQVIGRVMRRQGTRPVVIDILDAYSVFSSWGRKRQAYYRRQGMTMTYDNGAAGDGDDDDPEHEDDDGEAVQIRGWWQTP